MAILATKCPMCGSDHEITMVVSWPLAKPTDEARYSNSTFKLAGVNAEGEVCCSYDDYRYKTREAADAIAMTWGASELAELADERMTEALAVSDEHGYFMDYGPADSDYYD
jgi:hypothetical protein